MKRISWMGILGLAAALLVSIIVVQRWNHANADGVSEQKQSGVDAEKLAALDQAYKAGLLTKEEYEAKRGQLMGTSGSGAGARGTRKERGASLRLKIAQVVDQGFGERIEVLRLLIPADWRFEGDANWSANVSCPANLVRMGFRATSPDGSYSLELLPSYSWVWYDDPTTREYALAQNRQWGGCDLNPPMSAADFLRRMVIPRSRPNSRVVEAEALPALAQSIERYYASAMQAALQTGAISGFRFDAARVKLQQATSGQANDEWISAAVSAYSAPASSLGAAQNGQMGQTNFYALQGQCVIAERAPQGQSDSAASLFGTMLMTMRFNERWADAYTELVMSMQNTQLKGVIDRGKIWHEVMQKTDEIFKQSYENHQRVQDRLSEQWSQRMRERNTYTDPNTRESVELPSGYDHVWRNNRGEYLLTNSSDNPNATDPERRDWTRQVAGPQAQR